MGGLEKLRPQAQRAQNRAGGSLSQAADRGVAHRPTNVGQTLSIAVQGLAICHTLQDFILALSPNLAGVTFST